MEAKNNPAVTTGMLIRRPLKEVFGAFINPDITTNFWFTKSSGKLEEGGKLSVRGKCIIIRSAFW